MDAEYKSSLQSLLEDECLMYGEEITIDGVSLLAKISTSATTKKLEVAGYYKSRTLDVMIPSGKIEPKINQKALYNSELYYIKSVEELLYKHGYKLLIELINT